MTTLRTKVSTELDAARNEVARCQDILEIFPAELLDLEADAVMQYASGGRHHLVLTWVTIPQGMLTRILDLSHEDEVRAQEGFSAGMIGYNFTLDGGRLRVQTGKSGCRKYRVLAKEQKWDSVTVCGELDESLYAAVELIGEL